MPTVPILPPIDSITFSDCKSVPAFPTSLIAGFETPFTGSVLIFPPIILLPITFVSSGVIPMTSLSFWIALFSATLTLSFKSIFSSTVIESESVTPWASVTSDVNTFSVPDLPFFNALSFLLFNSEFIQPDKELFISGLKFLIWGINSVIVALTKSSDENWGKLFISWVICFSIKPCNNSFSYISPITVSLIPLSHSFFVISYSPFSFLGPTKSFIFLPSTVSKPEDLVFFPSTLLSSTLLASTLLASTISIFSALVIISLSSKLIASTLLVLFAVKLSSLTSFITLLSSFFSTKRFIILVWSVLFFNFKGSICLPVALTSWNLCMTLEASSLDITLLFILFSNSKANVFSELGILVISSWVSFDSMLGLKADDTLPNPFALTNLPTFMFVEVCCKFSKVPPTLTGALLPTDPTISK